MFSGASNNTKAILLAVAAFTCFGFGDVIYKYLGGTVSAYGATFFTGLFASAYLLLFSRRLGGIRPTLGTGKLWLHLVRAVVLFFQFLLVVYALQNMAIAKVYTIIFLYPFMGVMMAAALFRERIKWPQAVAIAVGFAGILVILRPGVIEIETAAIATFISAILVAIGNIVILRYIGQGETKLSFALYPELAMLLGGALLWWPEAAMPQASTLAWLLLAGVLNGTGIVCVSLAFSRAAAAVVAPFSYLQMIWGIVLSYLFLNDVFDQWMMLGTALIAGSGIAMIFYQRRQERAG
jgi:drug/metabolite transporter (DMT)-like permease